MKKFVDKVVLPKSKLSRRRVPLLRNLPSISRASNRMAVTDLRFSCEAMVRCQGLEPRNSSTRPSWDFPDPVFHTSSSAILWDFSRSLVLLSRSMIFSLLTPSNRAIYTRDNTLNNDQSFISLLLKFFILHKFFFKTALFYCKLCNKAIYIWKLCNQAIYTRDISY